MNKVISVVGARPNFMKVAPVHKAFKNYSSEIEHLICHTGQHYDEKMSKVFFDELELPKPDFYLGVGSASHAEQTAKVMIEFEKVLIKEKPDMIIVFGDVNSTVACSLTAIKLGIKVSHVEAGLRSFDRTMPEEINRLLTDQISDYLFVTEESGIKNLENEGISNEKVFLTGNVMIDSLVYYLPKADQSDILQCHGLKENSYVLVTLHRPSNVDSKEYLRELIDLLNEISKERKLIFPIHPRTKNNMKTFKLDGLLGSNVILTDPVGYIDFLCLTKNSELIITDSGGIQEESTYLKVQCLTVRNNTERPVTVQMGTNQLIGTDLKRVQLAALDILCGNKKSGTVPPLWDGHASDRIAEIVADKLK